LLILFIVVVLLVTLDAKYSENEYFPNPSLTSLATFTQVFFPGVFLIPVAKPVSALIMSDSNGDDGGDGGNSGSGCNCNDYDDEEKASTPTVTPTAMAMVAAMATEGNGRCNFSQLQWRMHLWR
jgi:hypothetical protein